MTPAHIVPEWYLLPFYAILRAIPNKLVGVVACRRVALLAFLPGSTRRRSGRAIPAGVPRVLLGCSSRLRSGSAGSVRRRCRTTSTGGAHPGGRYFVFLLVVLPLLGLVEKTKPIPLDRRRGAREGQTGRGGRAAGLALIGCHFGGFAKMIRLTTSFLAAALNMAAGMTVREREGR